jgi:hypothetical protein
MVVPCSEECPMTKFSINDQPASVRNAVRRLLKERRYGDTPDLAQNAVNLLVRLHDSGIHDEDELVELAALSGGKPLDERSGADKLLP